MSTDLGRPYALDWRGRPPHMLEPDIPVWYRFLDQWGSQFITLYYDSLLGGPFLTPQEKKDPMKWMWRVNNSKRTDAIAELENEVWIIEVASDPGLRILGQLQAYRILWLRDPKINKLERMVVVCERMDPDLLDVSSTSGLQIYIIP